MKPMHDLHVILMKVTYDFSLFGNQVTQVWYNLVSLATPVTFK